MNDPDEQSVSSRAFQRERAARKEAERLLEEKSREVFEANTRLSSLNRELEQRVAERTVQLLEAVQRAEEESAAKSRFLAVMSHELRTPLTTILGYAELLREPELDPAERGEFVQVVHRAGEHLLEMIKRVLQIAELDEEKISEAAAPVDLPGLLQDGLERVRVAVEEHDLRVVLRADAPVPRLVETVEERVAASFLAILENAVRFSDHEGSVRIMVGFDHDSASPPDTPPDTPPTITPDTHTGPLPESEPEPEPHAKAADRPVGEAGVLWIEVTDTGPGIAECDAERVFEPFEQVEGGMNRRWDGPGLGLAIARRSARALGGDVTLSSTPGEGASFRLTIPATASRSGGWLRFGESMPLPRRSARDAADGRPIEGLRVLLAEDQVEIRWLVRQVLERAGATVLEAGDGEELVATASTSEVDLVVTDLQMPRCDGYEAVRRLRQAGFDRPTIALTAHALGTDMRDAGVAGCDDYLVKPIDPVRLIDACLRWQGRRHHPSPSGDADRRPSDGPAGPDEPGRPPAAG